MTIRLASLAPSKNVAIRWMTYTLYHTISAAFQCASNSPMAIAIRPMSGLIRLVWPDFSGHTQKQIAHLIAQTDHWLFSDFLGYFGHSVQFRVRTLDELAECHSSVFNNLKIIKYTTISTGPHTAGSRRINHRRCSQFSFSLNTLTVRRFTYPDGLVQESE